MKSPIFGKEKLLYFPQKSGIVPIFKKSPSSYISYFCHHAPWRTTTLPWVSTTWSPSLRRWWSSSWRNSDSGHTHSWPSIQSNASGNGPKWFLAPKNLGFDTKIKSVACPEVELLHHEEVHHLFREVDHVVDTHGNVVVRTKRDHFSKYDPKRSNHANFQLIKIKNKKVMTKKPLIVENTNPL